MKTGNKKWDAMPKVLKRFVLSQRRTSTFIAQGVFFEMSYNQASSEDKKEAIFERWKETQLVCESAIGINPLQIASKKDFEKVADIMLNKLMQNLKFRVIYAKTFKHVMAEHPGKTKKERARRQADFIAGMVQNRINTFDRVTQARREKDFVAVRGQKVAKSPLIQ